MPTRTFSHPAGGEVTLTLYNKRNSSIHISRKQFLLLQSSTKASVSYSTLRTNSYNLAVWFNATSFFHLFKLFWDFFWHKRLTNITKMSRHLLKHFHLESIVLYIGDFLCNFLLRVSFDGSIIIIRKYSIFGGISISIESGNSSGNCFCFVFFCLSLLMSIAVT